MKFVPFDNQISAISIITLYDLFQDNYNFYTLFIRNGCKLFGIGSVIFSILGFPYSRLFACMRGIF